MKKENWSTTIFGMCMIVASMIQIFEPFVVFILTLIVFFLFIMFYESNEEPVNKAQVFLGVLCGSIVGICVGLSIHYAFLFIYNLPNKIVGLLIMLISIIIGEVLFLLDKKQPTKKQMKDLFWFTAKQKACAVGKSLVVLFLGGGFLTCLAANFSKIFNVFAKIKDFFSKYGLVILNSVGYFLLFVLMSGVFAFLVWGYIKLNSLKYRKLR